MRPTRTPTVCALTAAIAAALAACAGSALADDEQLESITVTAQSRTQAEKDVPIAMQAITEKQIEDLGATNLADINGYVPGLSVDGSQPTQPNFALRGIGTTDFGIGTDAPVGVYVDGVYTGKTGGSLMTFNDVQRIEVLKGPQGTLFGRNSAAGAISIVSNEPAQAMDASALLRYGRFDTVEFQGMVNAPLNDDMAVRLSVASRNSHGWQVDETTGERFGGFGEWGLRSSFKWQIDRDSKLITTWEHDSLDQPARAVYSLVAVPANGAPPFPPSPTTSAFVDPLTAPLQNDAPNRETRTYDGGTVRYESKIAGLDFTSLTAYRHFGSYNAEDNDGTSDIFTYLSTINEEGNTSWQQEFKVGAKSERLDWIAGASFYRVNASQTSVVDSTSNAINTITNNLDPTTIPGVGTFGAVQAIDLYLESLGVPIMPTFGFGYPWQERMVNTNVTTSYALYGDTIWHLDTATNLTFGLRWTHDHKDVSWFVPPYAAPGLDAAYEAITNATIGVPLTFGQLAGASPATPLTNVAFASAALTAASGVSASRSWGDLSPRLVLDHHVGANTMVYASVARGYQSGGFDVFSPLASFEPEHMINYEIGVKGTLPAQRLSYEASLFHYKFSNLQNITLVSQLGSLPVYDVTTSDQNATGADLGGNWQATQNIALFGNAEYIDQRYGTYSVQDGPTLDNLDGAPVGTPLLTLALGTRLSWALAAGRAEFVLQGSHTTATRCNAHLDYSFECLDNGTIQTGTAQTRVDLRLGWTAPEHRYGVALIVNNAFNRQYVSVPDGGGEAAYTLGTPYGSVSEPRTFLVEFSASL